MKLYILNAYWDEDGYILCFADSKKEALIYWSDNKECVHFINTCVKYSNEKDLLNKIIEKEISLGIVDLE